MACPQAIIALTFALVFCPSSSFADVNWETLTMGPTVTISAIVDGDTVIIDPPDGEIVEVRLVGIQAPKLPLGRTGFEPWPLGEESKAALNALVLGKTVTLYFGGRKLDRHGRYLAHIRTSDGVWAQGRMLRAGMARVYTFVDNRAEAAAMTELERASRAEGLGIWSHPYYDTRTPETVGAFIDRFELVSGVVRSAADVKGRVYLNFGEDWRKDFTIAVDKKARKLFDTIGFDLLSLNGKSVRVRGWVKNRNGPLINLNHPERLEILDQP